MIGIEKLREACEHKIQGPPNRSRYSKRVDDLVLLDEDCDEAHEEYTGFTLQAAQETFRQLFRTTRDNPMHPDNNPDGGLIPNLGVHGVNSLIELVRMRFRNQNPDSGVVADYIARVGMAAGIAWGIALKTGRMQRQKLTIKFTEEEMKRVKTKDAECNSDLVCLEDDCHGYTKLEGINVQTEFCTAVSFSKSPASNSYH